MSGFDNEVVNASGIDLTNTPGNISNQLGTDGFIYFGNGSGRPQAGLPTSSDGSIIWTPGPGSLDAIIDPGSASMPWNLVTTATRALLVDNGYVGYRASAITFTLPATSIFGSVIRITNFGVGLPIIAQTGAQFISFTATSTTVGVGGGLSASEQFSSIELLCVVADTQWVVLSSTGNWVVN